MNARNLNAYRNLAAQTAVSEASPIELIVLVSQVMPLQAFRLEIVEFQFYYWIYYHFVLQKV